MHRLRKPHTSCSARAAALVVATAAALAAVAAAPLPALGPAAAWAQAPLGPPRPRAEDVAALKRATRERPNDAAAWAAYGRALMARDTIEERQWAQQALRRAVALDPDNVEYRLALADLYLRQGYITPSRRQLLAALRNDQGSAPAYARLGRIAVRDWVKYQRVSSLETARRFFQDGARRSPDDPDPWLGLGVLALLYRDPAGALAAGRQVLASPRLEQARTRGEGLLLVGAGAYGLGRPELADSAFRAAMPQLAGPVRDHLLDITPAASDADTAAYLRLTDSGERARFLETFWRSRDPDLTTPWNEVQLELLSRATLAYFLFYDHRRRDWDERARYLVRYGPPEEVEYNPIIPTGEYGSMGASGANRLVWSYPSLGMRIYLVDPYLNDFYDLPISLSQEVDFVPAPELLGAKLDDGELARAGRGLFRSVLPNEERLRGRPALALFRRVAGFDPRISVAPSQALGGRGAQGRVEAYLALTGVEAGALEAQAVVYEDSTFREVARARTARFTWCQSETLQVVQFNFDLPAGQYVVGLSARDESRAAAGTWRRSLVVPPMLPGRCEISDLELACRLDPEAQDGPFGKTDYGVLPNPLARVPRGEPFGFYFEIYNLVSDAGGRSNVSLEYTIQSTRKDKRPFFVRAINPRRNDPVINVSRESEVPGRARFQYVTADLAGQAAGPYRITVAATDLATGFTARRSLDFELVD